MAKWTEFTSVSGVKAKYQVINNDNEYKVKILSKIPKIHYYSILNEVCLEIEAHLKKSTNL